MSGVLVSRSVFAWPVSNAIRGSGARSAHERHPCRIDPELHLYVLPAVSCHDHSVASPVQTDKPDIPRASDGRSRHTRVTNWTNTTQAAAQPGGQNQRRQEGWSP